MKEKAIGYYLNITYSKVIGLNLTICIAFIKQY